MNESLYWRRASAATITVTLLASSGLALAAPPLTITSSAAKTSTVATTETSTLSGPAISATAPIFEKGTPVEWQWVRFDAVDWIITGVAASMAGSSYFLRGGEAQKSGGILLDEEFRDVIRLSSAHQRQVARDTSDVLLSLMTSFPFLVDSLIITYWHRQSGRAAWEMALIDLQTIAINTAVQGMTSALSGRERPYGRTCGNELSLDTRDCENFNRNTSFYSGHTSLAFTIAGLVCTNHSHIAINGDDFSDFVPCAGTLAAATGVGLLRMLGDVHYLSDVLTGAAIGSLIGFGVPWLFHYRHEIDEETGLTFQVLPAPNGAAIAGTF